MKTNPDKWCNHCQKADHSDAECWSTRVVPAFQERAFDKGQPRPFFDFQRMLEEPAGMHKKKAWLQTCRDPEHNPPTHISIPGDSYLVHYCPTCRQKSTIYGTEVTL